MAVNILPILTGVIAFIISLLFYDNLMVTNIGLAFSIYTFTDFINKLGKVFPIKEFIILIACIQWVIGAKISYSLGKMHHKYYMYVDEDVYMNYVVPGVIFMAIGLFIIQSNINVKKITEQLKPTKKNISIAYTLVFIGVSAGIIDKLINIGGLAFFLFLANILLYVGVSYLFFLFPKKKWWFVIATLGAVFVLSVNKGMFHNLLLVTAFFSFILVPRKTSFITKLLVISVGFVFIYMLQLVKAEFREVVWSESNQNPIEVFYNLMEEEFTQQLEQSETTKIGDDPELTKDNADANNRFNQGWIISRVLENVPQKQPFLNGKTINEAIEASILPRFLAPNKVGADQALINFRQITGLGLSENASMGLSLIAEFYANYGYYGGWTAMFFYGLLLSLSIRFFISILGNGSYLIALWFILFFFQVVKAETDFIKIFNHLIKSIIFFLIIKYGLTAINIYLFNKNNNKLDESLTIVDENQSNL